MWNAPTNPTSKGLKDCRGSRQIVPDDALLAGSRVDLSLLEPVFREPFLGRGLIRVDVLRWSILLHFYTLIFPLTYRSLHLTVNGCIKTHSAGSNLGGEGIVCAAADQISFFWWEALWNESEAACEACRRSRKSRAGRALETQRQSQTPQSQWSVTVWLKRHCSWHFQGPATLYRAFDVEYPYWSEAAELPHSKQVAGNSAPAGMPCIARFLPSLSPIPPFRTCLQPPPKNPPSKPPVPPDRPATEAAARGHANGAPGTSREAAWRSEAIHLRCDFRSSRTHSDQAVVRGRTPSRWVGKSRSRCMKRGDVWMCNERATVGPS